MCSRPVSPRPSHARAQYFHAPPTVARCDLSKLLKLLLVGLLNFVQLVLQRLLILLDFSISLPFYPRFLLPGRLEVHISKSSGYCIPDSLPFLPQLIEMRMLFMWMMVRS